MYIGEHTTILDEKGRLNVPKDFRTLMAALRHNTWVATRGFNHFIQLYEKNVWDNQFLPMLPESDPMNPGTQKIRRFFLGSASFIDRDSAGRLSLPATLRTWAKLDESRDAVLVGMETHLELWSREHWDTFHAEEAGNIEDLASDYAKQRQAAVTTQGAE